MTITLPDRANHTWLFPVVGWARIEQESAGSWETVGWEPAYFEDDRLCTVTTRYGPLGRHGHRRQVVNTMLFEPWVSDEDALIRAEVDAGAKQQVLAMQEEDGR